MTDLTDEKNFVGLCRDGCFSAQPLYKEQDT